MTPVALSIAGSDPSGGAGLQADLKTFHQFGVYGEAVVTLITVQNSQGVKRVEVLDPTLVLEQLHAVLADIPPHAAKTGALGNVAMTQAVAQAANISGPAVGGLLYWIDYRLPFAGALAFYAVAATCNYSIRYRSVAASAVKGSLAHLLAGFRFMTERPVVMGAIVIDLLVVVLGE